MEIMNYNEGIRCEEAVLSTVERSTFLRRGRAGVRETEKEQIERTKMQSASSWGLFGLYPEGGREPLKAQESWHDQTSICKSSLTYRQKVDQ